MWGQKEDRRGSSGAVPLPGRRLRTHERPAEKKPRQIDGNRPKGSGIASRYEPTGEDDGVSARNHSQRPSATAGMLRSCPMLRPSGSVTSK